MHDTMRLDNLREMLADAEHTMLNAPDYTDRLVAVQEYNKIANAIERLEGR